MHVSTIISHGHGTRLALDVSLYVVTSSVAWLAASIFGMEALACICVLSHCIVLKSLMPDQFSTLDLVHVG